MNWLKRNYKQILVLVLSFGCAAVIHFRPDWRDTVLAIAAALGLVGVHLVPVTYGSSDAATPKPKAPWLPTLVFVLALGPLAALHACTPQARTAIETNIGDIAACVIRAVTGEQASPEGVLAECAGTTIKDVISIVEALLAAQPPANDAAAALRISHLQRFLATAKGP